MTDRYPRSECEEVTAVDSGGRESHRRWATLLVVSLTRAFRLPVRDRRVQARCEWESGFGYHLRDGFWWKLRSALKTFLPLTSTPSTVAASEESEHPAHPVTYLWRMLYRKPR
jgi:hypothetical protein